jgi:type VI secretion system secreted protein VgrG
LGKYGFSIEDKLMGNYREWTYMVQYGESDFNFVSRLMEEEGIFYFFSHSNGSHKLVLADDIGSVSPLPNGPTTIAYYPNSRAAHVHSEDFVDGWVYAEDIASGNFEANDYDFEKPKADLTTRQQQPAGHNEDSREQYEWPGGYTEYGDGENYARIRIEQQKAQREIAQGEGNARNIAPGYLFTLSKYPGKTRTRNTSSNRPTTGLKKTCAAVTEQEDRARPSAEASTAAPPTVSALLSFPKARPTEASASPPSPTPRATDCGGHRPGGGRNLHR